MQKRIALALAALLAACGGKAEDVSVHANLPARAPADEAPAQRPNAPESIAADVGTPSALALAGDLAIFTTRATKIGDEVVQAGAVFVVDKRVPPALMIALDKQGAPYGALATDGASAFYAAGDGRVLAVSLAGGAARVVATLDAAAIAIAASGDYVYFALESGAIGRVGKAGGAPEALASASGAVRGLVADDAAVYVAASSSAAKSDIVRVSLATREAKAIATAPGEPCAIARDDAAKKLFWTTTEPEARGSVLRVGVDGADLGTVASGSFRACAIAADGRSLYFATTSPAAGAPTYSRGGGSPVRSGGGAAEASVGLMRAPIGGGQAIRIAEATSALVQAGAVAVDATHLYWLTASGVMRLRK